MTTKNSEKAAVDTAISVESASNHITLSNGVVLKATYISPFIYNEVKSRIKKPKPPRLFIVDLGREEENPDDPAYLEELEEYSSDTSSAVVDVMMLMGIEVISVPHNVSKIQDRDWSDKLSIVGIEVPDDVYHRKLAWLKYYVCSDPKDLELIMMESGRVSGVTEEDTKKAAESFRDNT